MPYGPSRIWTAPSRAVIEFVIHTHAAQGGMGWFEAVQGHHTRIAVTAERSHSYRRVQQTLWSLQHLQPGDRVFFPWEHWFLEASTIVAKPMVPIKIVSLNAEPGAPEFNAVPAVRPSKPRKKTSKNEPPGPWREELHRFFRFDLTVIPGISILTGITLMTELGNDLGALKTAQDFSSWLCLCPDNETSASKVLRRATRKSQNRVRQAFIAHGRQFFAS